MKVRYLCILHLKEFITKQKHPHRSKTRNKRIKIRVHKRKSI